MERKNKKGRVHIIGGGPAGMMAAEVLSKDWEVVIFEKGKTLGRKFLVAGKGGFNLSNSAVGEDLESAYQPSNFLTSSIRKFDSLAVRQWLAELGIPTFVGSSGRIFPERGIKPIAVLQRWKDRLKASGVRWELNRPWIGFGDKMEVQVGTPSGPQNLEADYTVFALGGASWPVTGSTGEWLSIFAEKGIQTIPFQAANCGLCIDWPPSVKTAHAGKALKNIALHFKTHLQKGEATITEYGLEGNAVYPLATAVQKSLQVFEDPILYLDLKPRNTAAQLLAKIEGKSPKNYARALHLNPAQLAIVKAFTSKTTFIDPAKLVEAIKNLPLEVSALRPIAEAISTVGGIDLTEVAPDFSLRKYPPFFVIGEMLDWDAPTGGFLLQACFSMGRQLEQSLAQRIDQA